METFLSPFDFAIKCESVWDKRYTPEARTLIEEKLRRFGHDEIFRIFDYLAENSKFLPKISDIFEAASEVGAGGKRAGNTVRAYDPSAMPKTDCPLCGGVGLIHVYFKIDHATGEKKYRGTAPFGQHRLDTEHGVNEYHRRCACPVGDEIEPFCRHFQKHRDYEFGGYDALPSHEPANVEPPEVIWEQGLYADRGANALPC